MKIRAYIVERHPSGLWIVRQLRPVAAPELHEALLRQAIVAGQRALAERHPVTMGDR